jgi:phosphopantothenoylcysteine decarboxylase/phosphopantothenate--cysteine ligase
VIKDFPEIIVLGVCGGIAAYKSPDLVRRLIERGADVRVVVTRAAQEFVTPGTFQAVSGHHVHTDLWDPMSEAAMGHIELARWGELVLVAPATAHFLGALAHGLAADLLQTMCLATEAPVAVVPAMNRVMWEHPAVRANAAALEAQGVARFGPGTGSQACGEEGLGRMLEPREIVERIAEARLGIRSSLLENLKVVVTAGPTREPIDPVRYVTNRSSGKMGFAVAAAAHRAGARVSLVAGPVALPTPLGVSRIDVETAEQMYDAVQAEVSDANVFIACAAVSDYRPKEAADTKIKRRTEHLRMDFVRSPDTLASVAALPDAPFTVGFAAETHNIEQHAREKLERKGIDMIAANRVGPTCGFDKETNELSVFWRGGQANLGESAKTVLAAKLIEIIASRYRESLSERRPAETL